MQKALIEMNVQLSNVLSDISGSSGSAIIQAIIQGERDPHKLAALRDNRVKATRDQVAQSLRGTWKPELIFVLGQAFALRSFYLEKIKECDRAIADHLSTFETKADAKEKPLPVLKPGKNRKQGHAPAFDLRGELYRVSGADLSILSGLPAIGQTPAHPTAGWWSPSNSGRSRGQLHGLR